MDYSSLVPYDAAEVFFDLFVEFDKCGAGLQGLYYNVPPTHDNLDSYAIDFTKGYTLYCIPDYVWWVGGKCIPNPAYGIAELSVAATLWLGDADQPVINSAYDTEVRAGHPGVVIQSVHGFIDGDSNEAHANRVDIAIWNGPQLISPPQILADLSKPGAGSSVGSALAVADPDFWMEYLHLRWQTSGTPSLGMWVSTGTSLGRIDDTGRSFMSHLHLETLSLYPGSSASGCCWHHPTSGGPKIPN